MRIKNLRYHFFAFFHDVLFVVWTVRFRVVFGDFDDFDWMLQVVEVLMRGWLMCS